MAVVLFIFLKNYSKKGSEISIVKKVTGADTIMLFYFEQYNLNVIFNEMKNIFDKISQSVR